MRRSGFFISLWVLKVTQLFQGPLTALTGLAARGCFCRAFLCLALLCSQMSHSRGTCLETRFLMQPCRRMSGSQELPCPFLSLPVVSSDKVSRLLGRCEHPAPRITALESLLDILSTLEICLSNRDHFT